jgi:hypothetical protein
MLLGLRSHKGKARRVLKEVRYCICIRGDGWKDKSGETGWKDKELFVFPLTQELATPNPVEKMVLFFLTC